MAIEEGLGLLALGYYLYLKGKTPETVQFDADAAAGAAARQKEAEEMARLTVANKIVGQGSTKDLTDPRTFWKGSLLDNELVVGALTPTIPTVSKDHLYKLYRLERGKQGCQGGYGFELVANLLAPQNREPLAVHWTGKWGFVVVNPFQQPTASPKWFRDLVIQIFLAIATSGTAVSVTATKTGLKAATVAKGVSQAKKAVTAYQTYDAIEDASQPPVAGQVNIDDLLRWGKIVYSQECRHDWQQWYRTFDIGTLCLTRNPYYDYCPDNPEGQRWVAPCTRTPAQMETIKAEYKERNQESSQLSGAAGPRLDTDSGHLTAPSKPMCPDICHDGSIPQILTEPCQPQTYEQDAIITDGMLSQKFYWNGYDSLGQLVPKAQYMVGAWFEMATGLSELGGWTEGVTTLTKVPTGWTKIVVGGSGIPPS